MISSILFQIHYSLANYKKVKQKLNVFFEEIYLNQRKTKLHIKFNIQLGINNIK